MILECQCSKVLLVLKSIMNVLDVAWYMLDHEHARTVW